MKYKPFTAILCIIILLTIGGLNLKCKPDKKNGLIVLTINGEPVSDDEYSLIMSGLRSNVFSYFSQKYQATDNNNFWTTSFNGEIPEVILKGKTIDAYKKK